MIINFYYYWYLTRWKRIEHYLSKPSTMYFLVLMMLNKLLKIQYLKKYQTALPHQTDIGLLDTKT